MTQEQILLDVLGPRSGYIRGKGIAVGFYSKGVKQLATEKIVEQKHGILKEQHQEIQDVKKKMDERHERKQRELEEYKTEQQRAMEAFKKELLESLANRDIEE